jgi:hypothetical protein
MSSIQGISLHNHGGGFFPEGRCVSRYRYKYNGSFNEFYIVNARDLNSLLFH